jgi:hypothetical protein
MQVREAGSVDHRQLSLDLHPRYTAIASRSLTIELRSRQEGAAMSGRLVPLPGV